MSNVILKLNRLSYDYPFHIIEENNNIVFRKISVNLKNQEVTNQLSFTKDTLLQILNKSGHKKFLEYIKNYFENDNS